MKILVVGSTPNQGQDELFFGACYQLGRIIGQAGYGVVLGSNRYSTADHHVMRGLRSVRGIHQVAIVRPVSEGGRAQVDPSHAGLDSVAGRLPRTDEAADPDAGTLQITYHAINGPWGVGRVTQLLKANVVIAIGGRGGTEQVMEMAPELRVPVVAIPCFGGTSATQFDTLMRTYNSLGASVNDYYSLLLPWRDDHARTAVALASRLVRDNPFSDRFHQYLLRLLYAIFALFFLWVAVFVFPVPDIVEVTGSGKRITIFLLFWIAAFLGTCLRASKRLIDDPSARPSGASIIIDGAVGLSVSFGLSLLYMAGLLLASDDASTFPLLSEGSDSAKLRRTAVLMSLISFCGRILVRILFGST